MTAARTPAAAALAALALAACTGSSPRAEQSASPSVSAPVPTAPSATATAPPVTTPPAATSSPTSTMTAYVYYLHDSAGAKLYRELRTVPRTNAVVRAAVDAMLHLAPLDPDYRSAWPAATTVRGVSVSGRVATVDLSANARARTATTAVERQSLQQLVHTVTAAAPALTGVRLRFDGATKPTLWGHAATTGTLTRAAAADTLGAVWVTSPGQLSAVGRTLTVKGSASVFEATVSWSLRRASGGTVASGSTEATVGAPGRGSFTVTVPIPVSVTGDVVFTAWESSAEDGSVLSPDDKRFRVS
jgi:hypothetical protein